MFRSAMYCSVSSYTYKCTVEFHETETNPTRAHLIELGLDLTPYNTPSVENCISLPTLPLNNAFCGQVSYKLVYKECEQEDCPQLSPRTFDINYSSGCSLECIDGMSDLSNRDKHVVLGQCHGVGGFTDDDWLSVQCGNPESSADDCKINNRTVYNECVYYFNGKRYVSNTSSFCRRYSPWGNDVIATTGDPQKRPCFRIDSFQSFPTPIPIEQYSQLQKLTQSSIRCNFKPMCHYQYSQPAGELSLDNIPISKQVPINSNYWSTNACNTQFDCKQSGVCGSIDRKESCGLFSYNGLIGFPSNSGNYAERNNDPLVELIDLSVLFGDVSINVACGETTLISSCEANNDYNCKVPRCYLPTKLVDIAELPSPDEIDRSLWSPAQCEDHVRMKHCALDMQDTTQCATVQLPVYFECLNIRTGTYITDSSCVMNRPNDPVPGITMRGCDMVKGCDVWTNECFWQNKNPQMPLLFTDSLGARSEELCTKFDTQGDEVCDNTDFCGRVRSASSCVASKSTDQTPPPESPEPHLLNSDTDTQPTATTPARFRLDAELCRQLWPQFKDFDTHNVIECENHNRCSGWACSSPELITSLPSIDSIKMRTTGPTTAQYFNTNTGNVKNSFCYDDLTSQSAMSHTCGLTQLGRRVGCLTQKTTTHFIQPTWVFNPDAETCGSFASTTYNHIPINSTSIYTEKGCETSLECAVGNSEYSQTTCDYLTCPTVFRTQTDPFTGDAINTTTFGYDQQLNCIDVTTGSLLPLERCSNSDNRVVSHTNKVIDITTSCPYVTNYCQHQNLAVPMGFGPNANMTNSDGKYRPDLINRSKSGGSNALNAKFMLDAQCNTPATLGAINLSENNNIFRGNITLTAGKDDLQFQFGYAYFTGKTLVVSIYLVPTSEMTLLNANSVRSPKREDFIIPYLIGTIAPNLSSQYSIQIPSWVPGGEYIAVLYVNSITLNWIPDSYIKIIPKPTPEPIPSEFTQQQQDTTNDINTIDGIIGDCNGLLCLNGECVTNNNTSKCQCISGFTGQYCAQRIECADIANNVSQQSNGSVQTGLVCNKKYGVVSPDPTATSSTSPSSLCNQCTCLGNFDETDGCNTCKLQCGTGTVNQSCTLCTCPEGYSGAQCQCYTKRLLMKYRLPPPFIVKMFDNAHNNNAPNVPIDAFEPTDEREAAQLISWKQSLLNDLASDLLLPVSSFSVSGYGSTTSYFGVYVDLKLCSPYPAIADDADTASTRSLSDKIIASNQQQADALALLFSKFDQALSLLQQHTQSTGPIIGFDDIDNHLQYYIPSFDFYHLFKRFKALDGSTTAGSSVALSTPSSQLSLASLNSINNETLALESELFFDDEINTNYYTDSTFITSKNTDMQVLNSIETTVPSKYQYSHPIITMSVVADASGGLLGIGNVYDPLLCQNQPSNPDCTHAGLELTPRSPEPNKGRKEPFNKAIIGYIFIGLFFLILFAVAVLLCYSWKNQVLMFKDYKEKQRLARKARRNRSGKSGRTATGLTPITSNQSDSGPNVTSNNGTHVKTIKMADLAAGWTAHEQDGRILYVNSETMQSSAVKPNPDGTIPAAAKETGW